MTRTKKILLGAVSLVVIGTLVAVALMLFRAPIVGDLEVRESPLPYWNDTAQVMSSDPGTTCTVSVLPPQSIETTLRIDISGLAGSSCDIRANVSSFPAPELVVQDILYNAVADVTFINPVCGVAIPVSNSPTQIGLRVDFRITIKESIATGTYPVDAEAGLVAVFPEDFVAANCPSI